MPFEGFLHRRDQYVLAVLQRQSSAHRDADNVAGKAFDQFEHRLLLESDAPLEVDDALVALAVRDDDALAIHVLDAGGDEGDRVPDQVDESVPLLLGDGAGLGRPDQLRSRGLDERCRRLSSSAGSASTNADSRRLRYRRSSCLKRTFDAAMPALAARPRRRACGRDGEVGRQSPQCCSTRRSYSRRYLRRRRN